MPPQPVAKLRVVPALADAKPDLTIQAEPFWAIAKECPKLFRAHFREMGRQLAGIPFDLDWNAFAAASQMERLLFVTVRDGDQLVGYVSTQLGPHQNYKSTLHGFINAVWLHPDYRKGWTGLRLLKENEYLLKKRGVVRVMVAEMLSYKNANDRRLRVLFKRMGYTPIEVHWEKVL
jgi:GNAT superfamily N-acetyltransferase